MSDPEYAVEISDLTRKFGKFTAVDNVSFNVQKGEIFGFLGANGAGKTTLIRMLCGILAPTSGQATVAGFNIYHQTEYIKKNIGYMSQKFSLYDDLTISENIDFFGGIYGISVIECIWNAPKPAKKKRRRRRYALIPPSEFDIRATEESEMLTVEEQITPTQGPTTRLGLGLLPYEDRDTGKADVGIGLGVKVEF